MKSILKYSLILISLDVVLVIIARLLVFFTGINLNFSDFSIMLLIFSVIAFITIVIFFAGQNKEPRQKTLFILVAISLKFLLEIVFALLWLNIAKKSDMPDVLMFFVLYLSLTLFSIGVILKTLKSKAL